MTNGDLPTESSAKAGRITFLVIAAAIVALAAWNRLSLPTVPLSDPDSWAYIVPAVDRLVDGQQTHLGARGFVYPWVISIVLGVFGSFSAITVVQHLIGLLAGVVLLLAWLEIARIVELRGVTRVAWRALGLVLLATYLFSVVQVRYEHSIRPESVYPCAAAILMFSGLRFYRLAQESARAAIYWGTTTLFAAHLLYLLKPQTASVVIFASLLVVWTARPMYLGRKNALVTLVSGSILAALLLWVPEKRLAATDPEAPTFLPTVAMFLHMDLVADAHRDGTGIESPEEAELMRRLIDLYDLERERFLASKPYTYSVLGFNADAVLYGEPGRQVRAHFEDDDAGLRSFCFSAFRRMLIHNPMAYASKVVRQLGIFYWYSETRLAKHPMTLSTMHEFSFENRIEYSRDSLTRVAAKLERYAPGRDYLARIEQPVHASPLRGAGLGGSGERFAAYYRALSGSYSWVALVSFTLGVWLVFAWRRTRDTSLRSLVVLACVSLVFFVVLLGINLVAAGLHTLEIGRYIFAQQCWTLFGFATMALFIAATAHWMTAWVIQKLRRTPDLELDSSLSQSELPVKSEPPVTGRDEAI